MHLSYDGLGLSELRNWWFGWGLRYRRPTEPFIYGVARPLSKRVGPAHNPPQSWTRLRSPPIATTPADRAPASRNERSEAWSRSLAPLGSQQMSWLVSAISTPASALVSAPFSVPFEVPVSDPSSPPAAALDEAPASDPFSPAALTLHEALAGVF